MLQWINNFSIRRKLMFGFILVTIIPLTIAIAISSFISQNALKNDANEYNKAIAVDFSHEINQMIADRLNLLLTLSQTDDIRSMDISRQLRTVEPLSSQFSDMPRVFITDVQGKQTIASSGELSMIADRKYFQEVIGGASYSISDVLVSKGNGKNSIVICVPIKNQQGILIGTLSGNLDLQNLSEAISAKKNGQSGYVFITDKEGKVLAHPDLELMKTRKDISDIPAVKSALNQEVGTTTYTVDGISKMSAYTFVPLTKWAIVAQIPEKEALAAATKVKTVGIILVALVLLITLAVGFIFAGIFIKPITALVEATTAVADGNLSVAININSTDELGKLANSFSKMTNNLRNLIQKVQANAQQLAASSEELTASADQSSLASSQVASAISDIAQGTETQLHAVGNAVVIVDQMSTGMAQVAITTNSVANLADKTVEVTGEGQRAVSNAISQMNHIAESSELVHKSIQQLSTSSQQIGDIVNMISNIASQTNLLALNAAIEAARAGESGRGFAVVAEEVRKLAEQSQEAAKQIAHLIGENKANIGRTVTSMEAGAEAVHSGLAVVNNAGMTFGKIAELINQMAEQVKDIYDIIQKMNNGSHEVAEAVNKIDGSSKGMAIQTETVSAATEEQSASMEEIAAASQALSKMAGEMQDILGKFIV